MLEYVMTSRTYRFTILHQSVDAAIHSELSRRSPDPFRLFRLRKLRATIKGRLKRLVRPERPRFAIA